MRIIISLDRLQISHYGVYPCLGRFEAPSEASCEKLRESGSFPRAILAHLLTIFHIISYLRHATWKKRQNRRIRDREVEGPREDEGPTEMVKEGRKGAPILARDRESQRWTAALLLWNGISRAIPSNLRFLESSITISCIFVEVITDVEGEMASPRRNRVGGSPRGWRAVAKVKRWRRWRVAWRHLSLLSSLSLFLSCFLSTLLSELYKGPSHSNAHGNSNRYDALFWKFAGFSRSFSNFAVNAPSSSTFREEDQSADTLASRRRAAGIFALGENCGLPRAALFYTRIDS